MDAPNPGFTGKSLDLETNVHYFNARYYTGTIGNEMGPPQFFKPDLVGGNVWDPLSWNRYSYCRGNPVNFVDLNGREVTPCEDAYFFHLKLPSGDMPYLAGSEWWEQSLLPFVNTVPAVSNTFWATFDALQVDPNNPYEVTLMYFGGAATEAAPALEAGQYYASRAISKVGSKISGWVEKLFADADEVIEKINLHHSDPKFMGGDPKQALTEMPESVHKKLHKVMNDFLREIVDDFGNHMRPQRGNSGARIRGNFTRKERLKALTDFYKKNRTKFPEAAKDFFEMHPDI